MHTNFKSQCSARENDQIIDQSISVWFQVGPCTVDETRAGILWSIFIQGPAEWLRGFNRLMSREQEWQAVPSQLEFNLFRSFHQNLKNDRWLSHHSWNNCNTWTTNKMLIQKHNLFNGRFFLLVSYFLVNYLILVRVTWAPLWVWALLEWRIRMHFMN